MSSIERATAMSNNWLPIATAPKDGTRILLLFEGPFNDLSIGTYGPVVGCWADRDWWISGIWCGATPDRAPTKWQPLPPPDAYSKIEAGLRDALAHARGDTTAARVTEPGTRALDAPTCSAAEAALDEAVKALRVIKAGSSGWQKDAADRALAKIEALTGVGR